MYATGTVWTLERQQDREGLDRFPRRQDRDGLDTERRQDREGWDSGGHRTGTVWAVERRQDRESLDSNVATCRCIGIVWTKVETDWDGLDKQSGGRIGRVWTEVEQDWDGLDTKVFVSVPYVASVQESGIGTT